MKSSFKFLIVSILLWVGSHAAANSYNVFRHLTTKDGLSNVNVKSFIRDSYGFLWIGTQFGLNRYDGYEFKVYVNDTMPILSSNVIYNMQEDGLGNIWIKCDAGYMIYCRENDSFIGDIPLFLNKMGIAVDGVYRVYIDQNKDLWVLSNQKVFYYNMRIKKLKVFNDVNDFYVDENTEVSDDGDAIFAIQPSGKLMKLDKYSGLISQIDLSQEMLNDIYNVARSIYVDKSKGIWIYAFKTDLIFYKKSPKHEWLKIDLKSSLNTQTNIVQSVIDDNNGNVWIGTDHKGIFLYNKESGVVINYLHDSWDVSSLASNNVTCLYQDSNNVMWIGHYKSGISYYSESFQSIINFSHPECREVTAIIEDRKGNIWLGTDGNGLFVKENLKDGVLRKLPFPNYAIVSLTEDQQGRIWVGTYQSGLFCYENGRFSSISLQNSSLNNNIWSIREDRFGNILIGTLAQGVQSINPNNKMLNEQFGALGKDILSFDLFYDGYDKLYVGSAYGLAIIDFEKGQKQMYYGNKQATQKFKQMSIPIVFKDSQDNLWLGHNIGMTIWDLKKDSLYIYDKSLGLCDNIIMGIIEDDNQNVWVTTSNGVSLFKVNRNEQGNLNIACRNFTEKDGLLDNYFNNHSLSKLKNGDLVLGGPEGYSLIKPTQMLKSSAPEANVIFTGLSVGNQIVRIDSIYGGQKLLEKPMEVTQSLEFSYKNKLIAFQISAGDLINANKVKYKYKLDGFNSQWLTINNNVISFSTIPPGRYRLLVKACNSDGIWNDNAAALDLIVLPPFYLSNWAISFYYILALGLIIFFFLKRQKLHTRRLEIQRSKIEQEQLNRLNNMKIKFFTNISHDLRTPLTLILTPLQSLIAEVSDEKHLKKLKTVIKNAEQLLQLVNSLLDVRKLDEGAESLFLVSDDLVAFVNDVCNPFFLYASERNIRFLIRSENKVINMRFDHDKIQKVLNNLLANAFKFTPSGGEIEVFLLCEGLYAFINVSDTGSGIKAEDRKFIFERFYQAEQSAEKTGSGIGLHIVNEYVRMHGGDVSLLDNYPVGSVFSVKLPIEVNHVNESLNRERVNEVEFDDKIIKQSNPHVTTILIVDDNKDFCEFMRDSLSSDYLVLIGYNGQEALDVLGKYDVDIVVSDVMMPVMSGTELCQQIKTNINWSHIPVILLTAKTTDEDKIEVYQLVAYDYFTKPFNLELLKTRIRKLVERTEKQHLDFSRKIDVSPSEITITSLDEKFISNAIKIVEDNIGDPDFSVEELGVKLGISRSQLYKKTMSITGKGPTEFIRLLRLKRGMQLLGKSQLQIAEIAYTVGFNSPKRFSKYFRSEFGISPTEYLQKQKESDFE